MIGPGMRQVPWAGKRAIKRLKSRVSRESGLRGLHFVMGLNSLKDYDELFGEKAEKAGGASARAMATNARLSERTELFSARVS